MSPPRLLVWADLSQVPLIRDALAQSGATIAAVGSDTPAAAADVARSLDVPAAGDLRASLHDCEFDLLWLASSVPVTEDERRLVRQLGLQCISSEPPPPVHGEPESDAPAARAPRLVPLMRNSPGYRAASEAIEQLGRRHCVTISMRSGPGEGTLAARLIDAMDIVDLLCGMPQTIDAALAGPLQGVPDSMADLRGHMTANMRFLENLCACVAVSDSAGRWFRGINILGEAGSLRITDAGFDLIAPGGEVLESHVEAFISPGRLIGMEIGRLAEQAGWPQQPLDQSRLLGWCEAARLSCRTAEAEDPQKVLEVLSRP
jgi:hypothetical protein